VSNNKYDKNFDNDIGKKISSSLNESLNSGDFSGLKDAISESVIGVIKGTSDVIDASFKEVKDSIKDNGRPYGYYKPHSTPSASQAYSEELIAKRKAHNEKVKQQQTSFNQTNREIKQQSNVIPTKQSTELSATTFNPVGQVSGNVCFGVGIGGMLLSTVGALSSGLSLLFSGSGLFNLVFSGVAFAASALAFKIGLYKKGLLAKAKRFLQICGSNMYAEISSIASAMGVKASKVKKDIKTLLQKGYFPQGYLDDKETTLMLSEDVYKQYQITQNNTAKLLRDEQELEKTLREELEKAKARLSSKQAEELEDMVMEGYSCIKKLHKLNDEIPEETISEKLDNLEAVLRQIFKGVQVHPEQMERMHKFMDYYLPTMLKLVEAYAEYDKVQNPGEEILQAKEEIETTLDTIIEAFIQLQNNLFRDSVWDVTSDAQVLKTMLKQEGLASDINNY